MRPRGITYEDIEEVFATPKAKGKSKVINYAETKNHKRA